MFAEGRLEHVQSGVRAVYLCQIVNHLITCSVCVNIAHILIQKKKKGLLPLPVDKGGRIHRHAIPAVAYIRRHQPRPAIIWLHYYDIVLIWRDHCEMVQGRSNTANTYGTLANFGYSMPDDV